MRSLKLLGLAAVAASLAACGSSSSSSTTGAASASNAGASSNYTRALAFADCMRTHGVPNFPDPKANGNGGMRIEATPGSTKVNGVSVNGPAFQSAMQACHADLPNGGQRRPLSASQRQQALQFSQCMRAHGLTNFPDPSFSGGGVQLRLSASTGLDPNSPAFKAAQSACGSAFGKAGP